MHNPSKKKFYTIELLRFFSSISVVLYHYKIGFAWNKGFIPPSELIKTLPFYENIDLIYNYGFYGVQLFFLISGFVFAHMYVNRENLVNAKEFFINRFARLYPLHFLTLSIIIIFILIDHDFIKSLFNVERSRYLDTYHFVLNIFYIHSWGLEKGLSFNAPTWSVSVEIAVYITFFLALKYIKRFKIYFSSIIIIGIFILYKNPVINFRYSEYILLFYMGTFIYQINIKKYLKYFFILSILLILTSFFGRNFKILLFCPGILILTIILDEFIIGSKIRNFFSILGGTTYSLYLIHFPIMIIFLWLENNFIAFNSFYERNIFLITYFILLLIISLLSFKYFEKPLNIKIRKILK